MAVFDSTGPTGGVAPRLKKKRPTVGKKPHKKNPPLSRPRAKTQPVPKPYDPYAPLDPKAIEENARARAMTSVAPELGALASQGRDLTGGHNTRQQELVGWYGGLQNSLDKSYADTSSALNNLITLNNTGGAQANAALAGALNTGNQNVNSAAAMVPGVEAPANNDAQILAAAEANASNQRNFTAANAMTGLQAAGDRRSLATIGGIDASAAEMRRFGAAQKELQNQGMDLAARVPGLMNTARQDIQDRELQKGSQSFQQDLARQELGLKTRNQSFQEEIGRGQLGLDTAKFKHQSKIDWATVGLNQREVEARIASLKSDANKEKDKTKRERAQLRAKGWSSGLDMLSAYMAPAKGEASPGDEAPSVDPDTGVAPKVYRRTYDDALRILTGKARMSRGDALRMLMASDFPSWRDRARRELKPSLRDIRGGRKASKSESTAARKRSSLKRS